MFITDLDFFVIQVENED